MEYGRLFVYAQDDQGRTLKTYEALRFLQSWHSLPLRMVRAKLRKEINGEYEQLQGTYYTSLGDLSVRATLY